VRFIDALRQHRIRELRDSGYSRAEAEPPRTMGSAARADVHERHGGDRENDKERSNSICLVGLGYISKARFFQRSLTLAPIQG
jgi:hypothetical protein